MRAIATRRRAARRMPRVMTTRCVRTTSAKTGMLTGLQNVTTTIIKPYATTETIAPLATIVLTEAVVLKRSEIVMTGSLVQRIHAAKHRQPVNIMITVRAVNAATTVPGRAEIYAADRVWFCAGANAWSAAIIRNAMTGM